MTDISKNWLDLSVNSNILKSTYIVGFIDVSNNIVGRENLYIENQKNTGNTRVGLGTLIPSVVFDAVNNDPIIRITNTSLTAVSQNDVSLGTIEFVSPIYRGVTGTGYQTSGSIRCENLYDEYNYNGSLIFSIGGGAYNAEDKMVIRGDNGYIGIGTDNPHSTLEIIGNTDIVINDTNSETSRDRYGAIDAFGMMPLGSIIMFHGNIKSDKSPSGISSDQGICDCWKLCDGSTHNGITTPDLRNRFIVGANQASGDTNSDYVYKIGDKGGSNTVTLETKHLPSHNHSQSSTSGSALHRHQPYVVDANDYNYNYRHGGPYTMGTDDRYAAGGYASNYYSNDSNASENAGNHSHSLKNTGGGDAHENRPPYYALAFIMRVY